MSNFFYIKNGALVPAGSAATPTLSTIGDEDTGLYFSAANVLSIATGGAQRFDFANTGLLSVNSSGSMLAVSAASATVPSLIPNRASTTTGIGANTSGNLSLIATATEVVRITSTDMTMMSSARLFLAADPSDDLEASTKRYVDDSVASAITGGAAGAGLTFSLGALNIGTASSGRIVVNADNIDLATIGTAGTYQSVTVDVYGRVSAGLSITDLTSATAATSDEIAVASAANSFAARKVTLSSVLSAISAVSTSRTIATTAPLAGGGDLSANRTLTFSITSLVNTALTGSDELVAADASASFAPVKRTISSLISDLSIWTATNDGAASGLDADLLDGQHGSYYAIGSRNISTTLPIAGGGDLSADRTLSLNITGLVNTAVTSSDEIVVADASASFAPIKRTLGSALTDLGVISGLTPSDNGVVIGNGAAFVVETGATLKTSLGLTVGTDIQAYSANLTTWSGLAPSANGQSLVTAADYSAMRTLLGLVIGTNVQAYDAELSALAGLISAADSLPYFTGSGTAALTTLTSAGRNLIDDVDASAMRTTLGLVIGTNVQAYDADLTTWAGLTPSANAQSLVTAADYSAMRTLLGLVIGTNVQAYDSELNAIAGLTSAADRLPYFTGSGTAALATFTTAGRNLIDDADTTAQRTTLGLGTAATQATGTSGNTIPFLDGTNTWSAAQTTTAQFIVATTTVGTSSTIIRLTDDTAGAGPILNLQRISTTPTAGDTLGQLLMHGRNSVGTNVQYASLIGQINDETSGSEDGSLVITTLVAGASASRLAIGAGTIVGSPTGGDQGVGTINAVTLYENGTSLASKYAQTATVDASKIKYVKVAPNVALVGTISNPGTSSFDGVTLSTGERILLKHQPGGTDNGIYVFDTSSTPLVRASDSDTSGKMPSGHIVVASEGSSGNLDCVYMLTTNDPITLGSSNLVYTKIASASTAFLNTAQTWTANQSDTNASGWRLTTGAASSTTPTLVPNRSHTDTGIGSAGADTVSIIGFSTEIARYTTSAITHYTSVSDTNASGYRLATGAASSTAPTLLPNKAATTTGIGAQASGNVSIIASATEMVRITSSLVSIVASPLKIDTNDDNAVRVNRAAGSGKFLSFYSADSLRWSLGANATAESGSDAGTDFAINRYNDSGVYQNSPLAINRAAGTIITSNNVNNTNASGYTLITGAASGTAPTLVPNRAATTTGIGAQASGNISFIASATEAVRVTSTDVSIRGSVTMTLAVDPSSALHAVTKQYVDTTLQTLWIPAVAMVSRTTNGAASGTAETTTNKVMIRTLDFDAATIEYAQFQIQMPKSWNEGTVTAMFVWSHAATATNFGVVWALQGLATSDDDALDTAFGTAITVTDTGGTTNDLYRSSTTSAITIGGTPAENDVVTFQVYREATNGSDTMAIDARLHGVAIFLTVNSVTDT